MLVYTRLLMLVHTPPADAGAHSADAGAHSADAGAHSADAGAPPPDAGTHNVLELTSPHINA